MSRFALFIFLLGISYVGSFSSPRIYRRPSLARLFRTLPLFVSDNMRDDSSRSQRTRDSNDYDSPESEGTPEGYLNADISKIGDGKQLRVLIYIGFALVPVLFLVPFFLSRDFVPPVDPDAMKM